MRFGRRGKRRSGSRPEQPRAEYTGLGGTYEIEVVEDVEHYLPVNDGVHEARSTCVCDPIPTWSSDRSGWLHRSIPAPL